MPRSFRGNQNRRVIVCAVVVHSLCALRLRSRKRKSLRGSAPAMASERMVAYLSLAFIFFSLLILK